VRSDTYLQCKLKYFTRHALSIIKDRNLFDTPTLALIDKLQSVNANDLNIRRTSLYRIVNKFG
jgi:hypothetical protein